MLGHLRRVLHRRTERDDVPAAATEPPPAPRGPLLARETDPFQPGLGVAPSAIAEAEREGGIPPPYVGREIDAELDEALTSSPFVLLTGAAKAGKSGGAYSGATSVAPGVWVYQITKNGLALQLTLQGTKYYKDDDLNKT